MRSFCLVGFLLCSAFAQQPRAIAPIPADPLELAIGPVQVADTPESHKQALQLLELARKNHDLHRQDGAPFVLKASFSSLSNSDNSGNGDLEEIWMNGKNWQWTTSFGDYSQVRVFANGGPYDAKAGAVMPLRVMMVRSAVFWPVVNTLPSIYLRTAGVNWNGKAITCVLTSLPRWAQTPPPVRQWEEEEYCIDPESGRLATYSVAPGIYAAYDYNNGLAFHTHTLARQISVVESGRPILQIQLDSIRDPGPADAAQIKPTAEMVAAGRGVTEAGPFRFPLPARAPAGYTGTVQPVIVNASLSPDGKVLEAEALQAGDPQLSDAAVAMVKNTRYNITGRRDLQREAYINVKFIPAQ